MSNERACRRGLLVIVSSPSGAGKSTLCNRLRQAEGDRIWSSVSATTRPRRKSEIEGQDYYFVSEQQFERMALGGEFLEHAMVFGHRYGTPGEPVERHIMKGIDVLFDIDWQGAAQIRANAGGANVVSIFILPPSLAALEDRLRRRAQDSEETVRFRMSRARDEIAHWQEYDYVLVNDDLDRCFREMHAILTAERIHAARDCEIRLLAEALLSERVPSDRD